MLKGRQRVLVVGCPGGGKSTLSVELGQRLDLPVVHLDQLHWQPGWEKLPKQQWLATVRELIDEPRWLLDGNYRGSMALRMERCDAVLFLDLPRWLCVYGVLRRFALGRLAPRAGMPDDCREQLTWSFLKFVWRYPKDDVPRVEALLEALPPSVEVVRIRSRAELRVLLGALV